VEDDMTRVPSLAIHELRDGGGVPIVLIHAYPIDHRMWIDAADAMPANLRVLAIDLPGQGFSDAGNIAATTEAVADHVHDTLQGAGIANAVIVGLSMGGYVALAIAQRHPHFVTGLGLIDTKSTADSPTARAGRLKSAEEMEWNQTLAPVLVLPTKLLGASSIAARRHLLPTLEAWIHAQAPRGLAWAQRMMASRPDRTAVLEQFTGPIAIVVGDEDTITPISDAQHMADHAPCGVLTVVAGAGHLSALEAPAEVAAALADLHSLATRGRR
jgi:pimeloyl-ACP methyl ester carboxylesterase